MKDSIVVVSRFDVSRTRWNIQFRRWDFTLGPTVSNNDSSETAQLRRRLNYEGRHANRLRADEGLFAQDTAGSGLWTPMLAETRRKLVVFWKYNFRILGISSWQISGKDLLLYFLQIFAMFSMFFFGCGLFLWGKRCEIFSAGHVRTDFSLVKPGGSVRDVLTCWQESCVTRSRCNVERRGKSLEIGGKNLVDTLKNPPASLQCYRKWASSCLYICGLSEHLLR